MTDDLDAPYEMPDNAAIPLYSIHVVAYLAEDGKRRYKPTIRGDFTLFEVIGMLDVVKDDILRTRAM